MTESFLSSATARFYGLSSPRFINGTHVIGRHWGELGSDTPVQVPLADEMEFSDVPVAY